MFLFSSLLNDVLVIIFSIVAVLCIIKSSIYKNIPVEKRTTPKIVYFIPVIYVVVFIVSLCKCCFL